MDGDYASTYHRPITTNPTNEPLTDQEVGELAEVYPAGPAASVLLSAAGFPARMIPAASGLTTWEFWSLINKQIRAGILLRGRCRLLCAAAVGFPANPIFQGCRAVRRVLLIGASPDEASPVHADREFRAALKSGEIDIEYRPAADLTDLDAICDIAPDLLHLACHGDGEHLFLEELGRAQPVPVEDVVAVLGAYARHAGISLRGVYLASCRSAEVARAFTGVAECVVAFIGQVPDRCGIAFTSHLYRQLRHRHPLDVAAPIAVRTMAADEPGCASVADRVLVLNAAERT